MLLPRCALGLCFITLLELAARHEAAHKSTRRMLFGRRLKGFVPMEKDLDEKPTSKSYGFATFQQRLDHFDANSTAEWKQRYFYNYEFANVSGLNFLYIGGESAESDYTVTGSALPFVGYARHFGAALFSLEHRFYGQSRPTANQSVASLAFLDSRQALADVARFIRAINRNTTTTTTQKWIVFGGSYSGSLALWFRETYPELAAGAVGSSGPVLAQVDFYGYLKVVEDDIRLYDLMHPNNTLSCAHEAMKLLMLSREGRLKLDKTFDVFPSLADKGDDDMALSLFFQAITETFQEAAQYGGVHEMAENCDMMTHPLQGDDPVTTMRRVYGWDMATSVGYDFEVRQLSHENWSGDDGGALRSWVWQTCNEFGFSTSTDWGSNVFGGATIPQNFYLNICQDVFARSTDQVREAVERTNHFYGGRDYYRGTNVVITYGTHDPWHFLAKTTSIDASVVIVQLKNATHCRDLQAARGDAEAEKAQAITLANIDLWINGPVTGQNSVVPAPRERLAEARSKADNEPSQMHLFSIADSADRHFSEQLTTRTTSSASFFSGSHFSRRPRVLPPTPDEVLKEWPADLHEGFIRQKFDHLNSTVPSTFKQRFWTSRKFGGATAPNFLMIGAEFPESMNWITNEKTAWMTYAKEVGANVFILEHRYYGKSKLNTTDLRYLTSLQMLHDVVVFIETAKESLELAGSWITFGGSYSGELASWSRALFPHLIAGAVASSAPVQAKVDFYEYLEVVERVFALESPECLNSTALAFSAARLLASTPDGRAELGLLFNISPPWRNDTLVSFEDVQNVFSQMYGVLQEVVQYSGDNFAGAKSTTKLCEIMTKADVGDGQAALHALRDVFTWDGMTSISGSANDDNFQLKALIQYIDGHDSEGPSDDELAGLLWTWQTCNEFGFLQSTDAGKSSVFASVTPVNLFIQQCEQVFGIAIDSIAASVERNNRRYGGKEQFTGTNVVLPNGDRDPWHVQGILASSSRETSVVPILISGAAHCADMYPEREEDEVELKEARRLILAAIKKWLAAAELTTTPESSTVTSVMTTTSSAGALQQLRTTFIASLFLYTFLSLQR